MAIAWDASANGNGSSTFSYNHTCTGSNLILFVTTTTTNVNLGSVSGVTYNSVAMTAVSGAETTFQSNNVKLWYLLAPATGTNSVSVSCSGTNFRSVSSSYANVYQGSVPNAAVIGDTGGNANSLTLSVTPTQTGCWAIYNMSSDNTPSASTGSTSRGVTLQTGLFDSNGTITSGSPYSMTATFANGAGRGAISSFLPDTYSPTGIKTIDELAKASVKTVDGLAIASVKTWNGLA